MPLSPTMAGYSHRDPPPGPGHLTATENVSSRQTTRGLSRSVHQQIKEREGERSSVMNGKEGSEKDGDQAS